MLIYESKALQIMPSILEYIDHLKTINMYCIAQSAFVFKRIGNKLNISRSCSPKGLNNDSHFRIYSP